MKHVILATLLITAAMPAYAADTDAMMNQLKTMQMQMQQMQKEMDRLKSQLAESKANSKAVDKMVEEAKAAKIATRPENDVKISMVPAPKFETADGAYSFKVGGFAQIDAGMFSDDRKDHPDGTNVRRARLSASGTIAKDFKYKIENDFAGNASALTDVFLEYAGFDPLSITVGQFKEPFGLETLTSDLFTTFMERASPVVFSPDRKIGVMVSKYGDTAPIGAWTASLGGFGGATSTTASTDDEARDITGRLTWAPWAGKTQVLHLGVAGSHRIPDGGDAMTFSSRAENQFSSATSDLTVTTGSITGINDVNLLGLEAAGVYGPFSLQSEYVRANIDRNAALVDETFKGYYVEASYFLTGESRNYQAKQGKFDRVTPKWPFSFSGDGWGAWQIATRWSDLDLNGKVVHGGNMKDLTFGLRWIPQANVSFLLNYIRSESDGFSVTPNDDPEILMMRAQVDF